MNKYWQHFKAITKHKWVVFKSCAACGLIWQGIIHDLSKYSPTEFIVSAKYFQGNRNPIDAEKEEHGYSLAWNHHKGHNPHHWQYWTDFDKEGNIILQPIPDKYIVEMICDWIGVSKVYKNKWSNADPYKYYMKIKKEMYLHPQTVACVELCLSLIKDTGLRGFYRFIRKVNVKEVGG